MHQHTVSNRHTHVCTHARMHANTHIHTSTHTHACTHAHAHTHMYTHTHTLHYFTCSEEEGDTSVADTDVSFTSTPRDPNPHCLVYSGLPGPSGVTYSPQDIPLSALPPKKRVQRRLDMTQGLTQGLQESSLPLGKTSECYLLFIHVLLSSAVKCVSHILIFLYCTHLCMLIIAACLPLYVSTLSFSIIMYIVVHVCMYV